MSLITEMRAKNSLTTPLGKPRTGPDLTELAEDWLTVKNVANRPDDKGNSDRDRRSDLTRWAGAFAAVLNPARNSSGGGLEVWSTIPAGKLADPDVVVAVLGLLAEDGLAVSTRLRLLATLRGWCDWLVRRGYIDVDPTLADEVRLRWMDRDLDGKAFTVDDVERLVQAAGEAPGTKERAPWPARDVAIVSILAGCGLRVSELCSLTIRSYDTSGEQALLRLRQTKGGKGRTIPIPRDTLANINRNLAERAEYAVDSPALAITVKARVFVGNEGQPMTQQFVDRLLRRLCDRAGVGHPDGAMAHALRHYYASQLAVRGGAAPGDPAAPGAQQPKNDQHLHPGHCYRHSQRSR